MALLEYKPRPKMRSWASPEPPPPRRSRFLWFALAAWIAALYIGYQLVWQGRLPLSESEPDAASSPTLGLDGAQTAPASANIAQPRKEVITEDREAIVPTSAPGGPVELPACEAFLAEARTSENVRMPASLGRSALDAFIGHDEWLKPCRGRHRRRVSLCAALRDGNIIGLTLRAEPKDLTLETCVREQALKIVLRAEPNLRVVKADLAL